MCTFKIIFMTIFIVILNLPINYPQQQQHINWPSLADSPWPISRGDAQATGRSKYIGPRTPNVIWRKDMPLGVFHGPVIGYNDDLFIGTNSYTGFIGDSVNFFYSLDKNGNDIWTFSTNVPTANVAGPTISNEGIIYFSSISGGLYALYPNGTLKWKNERFPAVYITRYISLAQNGKLYIPWSDSIFVVEQENGYVVDSIFLPGIFSKEIVFSTNGDSFFYLTPGAINSASLEGEILWNSDLPGNNNGVPLVDNANRIYVYGTDNQTNTFLYCFNSNGTVNWKYPLDLRENYSSPTIDGNGNIIFQSSTIDSGYIISVDYDGNLNWKTNIGHYENDGAYINHGLVSDAEGKIYCGSSFFNTNFWCLDSNGTILWKLDLEGYEYDTSPAINSEGTLYIGTHKGSTFTNHIRNLIAVNDNGTSVESDAGELKQFMLFQNYPNPFNPATHIDYIIMEKSDVKIKVYNLVGQLVQTLVDEEKTVGYYSRIFNGGNLPSGVYFYTLQAGEFRDSKKMILIK